MELWNRRGKHFPISRGRTELLEILKGRLPPGMAVEGEWMRSQNVLYLFDVTYFLTNVEIAIVPKVLTTAAIRNMESDDSPGMTSFDVTEENQEILQEMVDSDELTPVRQVPSFGYHFPPAPSEGSRGVLTLPPDDWVMELKLNGDRVLVFEQPPPGYQSLDLRTSPYWVRRKILDNLVQKIGCLNIQLIPAVETNFPGQYERWKAREGAEGVVFKQKNSIYQAGTRTSVTVSTWIKRRYNWD